MALKWMRRKQQNLKWVLWLVIIALSGSMLLFFVNTPGASGVSLAAGQVARVGNFTISALEYRQAYSRRIDAMRQFFEQNPALREQVEQSAQQQALSDLIDEYAAVAEAERLGLSATSQEAFDEITRYPAFQDNGQFVGKERYREVLRVNRIPVDRFEDEIKRTIVVRKLYRMLTDSIDVTRDEIRQEFLDRNQEVKIRYVALNTAEAVPDEIDEADLRAHYDANIANYQADERRKVKLVSIEVRPDDVDVSAEEIAAFRNADSASDAVRVSHIVIPTGGDEAQARRQAEKLVADLRSGADFNAKARELSADEATKDVGGDLGFVKKGERGNAFDDVVFRLQEGEVGGPIQTDAGFEVVKMTATQASQAESIAEFQARQSKANKQAQEIVERILNESKAGGDMAALAAELGQTYSEPEPFERSDQVPGTAAPQPFTNQIFDLQKDGFSEAYRYASNHFFVAQLVDIVPARGLNFEEARAQVEEEYRDTKGVELAQARAQELTSKVSQGTEFDEVARGEDLALTTTEFFKKNATVDDVVMFSPPLHEQAFRLNVGEMGVPVEVKDNVILFQVIDKSTVDEEKFTAEQDGLRETLLTRKKSGFFSDYMNQAKQRLREDNDIETDLTQLDAIVR